MLDDDDHKTSPAGSSFTWDNFNNDNSAEQSDDTNYTTSDVAGISDSPTKLPWLPNKSKPGVTSETLHMTFSQEYSIVSGVNENNANESVIVIKEEKELDCNDENEEGSYSPKEQEDGFNSNPVGGEGTSMIENETSPAEDGTSSTYYADSTGTWWKCNVCEKSFDSRNSLKVHTRIHMGLKPFECNQCGQRYTRASTLKMHKRTHHNPFLFQCRFCNKMLATAVNLRLHEAKHQRVKVGGRISDAADKDPPINLMMMTNGEMIAADNACDYFDMQTGADEERKYICKLCSLTFPKSLLMGEHLRMHQLGTQRFCCPICGSLELLNPSKSTTD